MAKRFFVADSFDLFELDLEFWDYPRHAHNFFELVFIVSGKGMHYMNDSDLTYKEGDVFLLTPSDEHEFVVEERTVFGYVKFTEHLFIEKTELVSDLKWRKQIDAIILHSNSVPRSIMTKPQDTESVFQLYQLLKKEFMNPSLYGRSILLELFGALLMIISRNIKKGDVSVTFSEKDRVTEMLTYIRQNISNPEMIKISAIAANFNMSSNYVSVFIKKHAGLSIQQYVLQTKINMAARLLKQTSLNINQIAQKFNFTDASHFTKAFKKMMGTTPKRYRKEHQKALVKL